MGWGEAVVPPARGGEGSQIPHHPVPEMWVPLKSLDSTEQKLGALILFLAISGKFSGTAHRMWNLLQCNISCPTSL